jgi:hypothetical protein
MMDRVRHARTGNKKQGRQINPEKFTPGGIAGYAGGGAVAFQTGGVTGSVNPNQAISNEQNISEWAGPYVGDMLSKTSALTNTPYQAYQGPLSAGTSPLQQQAFTGLSNLQTPSQFGMATNLATQAGQRAGDLSNYTPSSFSSPQPTKLLPPIKPVRLTQGSRPPRRFKQARSPLGTPLGSSARGLALSGR